MYRSIAIIMTAAGIVLSPHAAGAHPHAWIDLTVSVLFDAQGRAIGLKQTWLLDDFYTAYAVQGRDKDGDGVPDRDELEALLDLNLSNLAAYGYFTKARRDGKDVAFGPIGDTASRMVGNRLEMSFGLPFAEPVSLRHGQLSYSVYDPTYYIEVLHAEGGSPIQLVDAPDTCRAELESPSPEPQAVSLAASLDRTQSAGDKLGGLFAEVVNVRCN